MNRDSHSIFETYQSSSANKEIIQEGLFDRLSARGSQARATWNSLGQQAAGAFKGAVAGVKGDVAGVQAARQQRQAGAVQGDIAKIENYRKKANKKIQDFTQDLFNDMNKLGINVSTMESFILKIFNNNLNTAFDKLIEQLKQPAAQTPVTQPKSNVASSTGMSGAGTGTAVGGGFTKPGTTTPHKK